MFKRFFVLFMSLLMLTTLTGCNRSEDTTADTFFDAKDGAELSEEEIRAVIADIPSDEYRSYPDTHNIPLSATLYKDGEVIALDRNDPRLIKMINFFNNCVYYSQCAYTQSLLPLNDLEANVLGASFRLELTYTPSDDIGPAAYSSRTTGCDTIVITNTRGFTLISHEIPGYEGREEQYPYLAVGFYPLYRTYPWLDWFGF